MLNYKLCKLAKRQLTRKKKKSNTGKFYRQQKLTEVICENKFTG